MASVRTSSPHQRLQKMHAIAGIPLSEQTFTYAGRHLKGDSTIAECGILTAAVLRLVYTRVTTSEETSTSESMQVFVRGRAGLNMLLTLQVEKAEPISEVKAKICLRQGEITVSCSAHTRQDTRAEFWGCWHGAHCLCNIRDLGGNRQHSSPNTGHHKLLIKHLRSSMFLQTGSFTAREISHLNSNTCDCTSLWHFSLSLPVSQQDVRIYNLPIYASW